MNDREASVRRMLACLGDNSRFRLVRCLMLGDQCVTELARQVGLSQSCTTRHLQALQREGIVLRTRDGKRVLYQVRSDSGVLRGLVGWVTDTPYADIDHQTRAVDAEFGSPFESRVEDRARASDASTDTESPETSVHPPFRRDDLEDFLL